MIAHRTPRLPQLSTRPAVRLLLTFITIAVACLLGLLGLLLAWSPGKPKPFLDDTGRSLPGSISEKLYLTINGVPQGMFIKSTDAATPSCCTCMGACLIIS